MDSLAPARPLAALALAALALAYAANRFDPEPVAGQIELTSSVLPVLQYDPVAARQQAEAHLASPPPRRGLQPWHGAQSPSYAVSARPWRTQQVAVKAAEASPAAPLPHASQGEGITNNLSASGTEFAERIRQAGGR